MQYFQRFSYKCQHLGKFECKCLALVVDCSELIN